ncbi:ORF6C domain-containing protein [Weissella tructae]|uniref:ORF6C domain-containing protein n=1 Tax=Weissella tructae TaxID=887702 RepID=UPI003D91D444
MNAIKVLGTEIIDGNSFIGIEGGFGVGKRSMLVRDIAAAMSISVKRINELINKKENRKRFTNDVEIIDLKSKVGVNDLTTQFGFSEHSVRMSKNIYLLSERGYAKLLKIMDSDEAWEQYDKFVDGYFQYREAIKVDKQQLMSPTDMMRAQLDLIDEVKSDQVELRADFEDIKENMGLPHTQAQTLLTVRKKHVASLLGGYDSNAYFKMSGKVFARMGRDFKDWFEVPRYDALPISRFDEALEYTKCWQLPNNMMLDVRDLNSQMELEVD